MTTSRECAFPGCDRLHDSRGLCASHAYQRKKGKPLTPIVRKDGPTICSVDGCEYRVKKQGLCQTHASHSARGLELRPIPKTYDPADEAGFWARVDKSGDCWEWTRSLTRGGYGNLRRPGGKNDYAHRVAYAMSGGIVPPGMHLDHLCRNRKCVRPEHLEPVTPRENARRGAAGYGGVRTRCRHGHDITDPANVYTAPKGDNRCRICMNLTNQRGRRTDQSTRGSYAD